MRVLLELSKARITVFVTASVATGYLLFAQHVHADLFYAMAGVFLLACGSAALNQVQERDVDARMARTARRPLPSGRITPEWALFASLAMMGAGLSLLGSVEAHTLVVVGLGAFSVLWYNGVYLWLKRTTAFAVVPGALVGAIPPMIGWCAAGGVPTDAGILEVAGFFLLWQIPHFWLLLQLYGPEYEAAGLPSLTQRLTAEQLRRITLAWILAVAATGLALAARQRFTLPYNALALVAAAWLVLSSLAARPGARRGTLRLFVRINAYALAMMVLLCANALAR